MTYPMLVYRCPGTSNGPKGTTYETSVANDDHALDQLLIDGWRDNMPDAVDDYLCGDTKVVQFDDSAPVSRAELIAKANELGLVYKKHTRNDTLLSMIDAALKEIAE